MFGSKKRSAAFGISASIALATFGLGIAATISAACTDDTTTTTYTPVTGVIVRAQSLTAGIGCGTASDQIFKYVAVAVNTDDFASIAGVYDCYADAVLVNLTASSDASIAFTVHVYAFNQAAYEKSATAIAAAVAAPNTSSATFAGPAFASLSATYTTTCTATEEGNIQAVAVCGNLVSTSPTGTTGSGDAGSDAGADAGLDANADAGSASDAGDSASDDAGDAGDAGD